MYGGRFNINGGTYYARNGIIGDLAVNPRPNAITTVIIKITFTNGSTSYASGTFDFHNNCPSDCRHTYSVEDRNDRQYQTEDGVILLTVRDLLGKTIFNEKVNTNKIETALKNLNLSGLYIISTTNNLGIVTTEKMFFDNK